jgi:hypothetical protein
MSHTQSIPIQNVVIDAWQLEGLLGELSSFCKPACSGRAARNSFEFIVGKKTDVTSGTNSPPRSFLRFFTNRVEMVELKAAAELPARKVVCRLAHAGSHTWQNKIDLVSEDEAWLKQASERVTKIVAGFKPQNTFLNRAKGWLSAATALPFGWVLMQVGSGLLGRGEGLVTTMSQWSMATVLLLRMSMVIGFAASMGVFRLLARLFPSVELVTGQPDQWIEKRVRKYALAGAGVLILGAMSCSLSDLASLLG